MQSATHEALAAIGSSAAKNIPKGTDADTPIAQVLWQANNLAAKVIRDDKNVDAIVNLAKSANKNELNESQIEAVTSCAKNQLTIVWGPPGIGKTDTLVAFLHSVIRLRKAKKILVAGPNYRMVEELSERLVKNIEGDSTAICDYYWPYSKSRGAKPITTTAKHLNLKSTVRDETNPDYQELIQSLRDDNKVTLVSHTAHFVHQVTKSAGMAIRMEA